MSGRALKLFKNFDWLLFSAVALLVSFGLVEIYSVALGRQGSDLLNFRKQVYFALGGMLLLAVLSLIDYNEWRGLAPYVYIGGLLLLVAVLFFGVTIRGTTGWFRAFGLSFQPVELMKPILLLALVRYFSTANLRSSPGRHFVISGLITAVPVGLVLLQPDFGSAFILLALWLWLVVAAGFGRRYLLLLAVLAAALVAIAWMFIFVDYQKERVLTFVNPAMDPLDRGYNLRQSIIAIGAGRFLGRGLGFGSQSQLKFLPESQNDFIFAVIAEELGLLGVGLVFVFFLTIFYRFLRLIRNTKDAFAVYFVLGAAGLIFSQMFINIAMNLGLLPVIGISLPFVSYGGSALVTSLGTIGIVLNIALRSKQAIKY